MALGALIGGVAVGGLLLLLRQPGHEGDWVDEHRELALVIRENDAIKMRGIRDFRWDGDDVPEVRWREETFRLSDVDRMYFVVEPFQGFRGAAHTFLSFHLGADRFLVVSLEARREVGQAYGVIKGMLRTYPLIMVWGTERDLIGLRTMVRGNDLYLYPVRAEPEAVQRLLGRLLERHEELVADPEFYHTIWRNCTGGLLQEVNALYPGAVPWHRTWIFPENLDLYLFDLDLIETPLHREDLRSLHRLNEAVARHAQAEEFSARIRDEIFADAKRAGDREAEGAQ